MPRFGCGAVGDRGAAHGPPPPACQGCVTGGGQNDTVTPDCKPVLPKASTSGTQHCLHATRGDVFADEAQVCVGCAPREGLGTRAGSERQRPRPYGSRCHPLPSSGKWGSPPAPPSAGIRRGRYSARAPPTRTLGVLRFACTRTPRRAGTQVVTLLWPGLDQGPAPEQ